MNSEHITKSLLNEQEITAAKTSVSMSLQSFEMAMAHLANRVQVTSKSVNHAKDIITAPKRILLNIKGTVLDFSDQAVKSVKKNPRPFIMGAAGVIGFGVIAYFLLKKPQFQPIVFLKKGLNIK